MKNPFDKILNWYFTKNSLPYWSIFLIDCGTIAVSGVMVYWAFHSADMLLSNTSACSILIPALCAIRVLLT